jgi:DNA-binding transcriptional LysR family regulator
MDSGPPAIDLRHLRYFLAVAYELHFGRAAARLGISQPPLSRAIRKLEDELGVELLLRSNRRVALTDAGNAFAEHARAVLTSFHLAVAEGRRAGGVTDALRIGVHPTLPLERLQLLIAALTARGLQRPRVAHLFMNEQAPLLGSGALDLGIFFDGGELAELETELLFVGEPAVAFLAPGHPLTSRSVLGPSDLADEVFLTFPRASSPPIYDWWLAAIEDAGYRFREVREAGSANPKDVLVEVAAGTGVMLGQESFIAAMDSNSVVGRPLSAEVRLPDLVVAWRADPPPHLEPLLAAVREAARDLYRSTSRDPAGIAATPAVSDDVTLLGQDRAGSSASSRPR